MYRPFPSLLALLFALFLIVLPSRPSASLSVTTGDLTGVVKDAQDKPIENATVRIAGGPELRSVRTDDKGKYTLTDLIPGTYDMYGQKPGYTSRHKGDVSVPANATTTLDFKLEWGDNSVGALEVFAVDSSGQVLPDATVDLTRLGSLVSRSTTDSSGSIVFPGLTPATYRVQATRPGFAPSAAKNIRVNAKAMASVNLKLKRDARQVGRLSGTVRDRSGAAVANAKVTVVAGLSEGETRTSSQGSYQLTGLIPGDGYAIQVAAQGFSTQTTGNISINAQQLTLRDVTLLPNSPTKGSLTGTITDPQGNPVPFATVSITAGPGIGDQALSGTDGFYSFTDLAPSTDYAILAESSGFSSAGRGAIRVVAGVTSVVNLQLATQTSPPGTVAGTVRAASGQTLANVIVTALIGPSAGQTTTTDGSGQYRLEGLQPDPSYTIRFTKTGYLAVTKPLIEVESGFTTTLNVALSEQDVSVGTIAGVVKNADGKVIKGAKVTITAGPSSPLDTTTAADGSFTFRNLRIGTGYAIKVEKADYVTVTRTALKVTESQTTRADFTIDKVASVGTISGRVTDLIGHGIANAVVDVVEGPRLPDFVRTDSTGRFTFDTLPSGRYTLEASANGYVNGRRTGILVSTGSTTNVTISLLRP
jgi:protocatechuate 3,4-dioxygenase beta subunit